MSQPAANDVPRWAHLLAVLTVCATLPLLAVGAEVTTRGVGMVDPRGFRWPWEIVPILADAVADGNWALFIELTHRLFGFLVGILAIALCVALLTKASGWKRWLGAAALLAVITQGLLGRYRVDLNALFGGTLALVHGSFAQLVFALLVATAVWTSRAWNGGAVVAVNGRLRHASSVAAVVIYAQLVLGAVVRHKDLALGARLHLLGAFAVVAAVLWLVKAYLDAPREERAGGFAVALLGVLVVAQLALGVEAWLSKFAVRGSEWVQTQPLPLPAGLVRSLHYLVGALTFATAVTAALWTHQQAALAPQTGHALEGAA
jgi:heme A synthase